MNSYKQEYDGYKQRLEAEIEKVMNSYEKQVPEMLFKSMKYSVCGGGKRIRGVLLMAVCHMLGVDENVALTYGTAAEMIHGSSLIHDDLPCMDNDTMRRGKPCNHIVFGEANALYAGLGLLNMAYELLLDNADNMNKVKAAGLLAASAGVKGIMKGQSLDIFYEGKEVSFDTLKIIHECKTGALLKACVLIPAVLKGANGNVLQAMEKYGENIGTAFQIVDDILDVTSTSEILGKTAGKDDAADKITYVKLFGVDKAQKMAKEHVDSAISCLDLIEYDSSFLKETAKLILNRRN